MTILKIEWKTHFKSLLVWSGVVALVLGMFMAFFPSMQSSGMQDLVNTKMNALPKEMMNVLHISSMADLTKIDAYFAYVFQYIFIAACVYAAMIGAQALVKEETDGTIEFLYAQPITRSELVAWKMVGNAISFIAFWAITFVVSTVLVVFLTYILGILAGLNDKVDFFKYFSPINFAIPSDMIKASMESVNVWITVISMVVFIALTFVLYRKKDLRV